MKADRDLIIIGAGAAGLAAAQYAARANLPPLLLEELASGGQALIIDKLENYPGFPEPSRAPSWPGCSRSRRCASAPRSSTRACRRSP